MTCPRCERSERADEAAYELARVDLHIAATGYERSRRGTVILSEFAREMLVARAERELEQAAVAFAGAVQVAKLAGLEQAADIGGSV